MNFDITCPLLLKIFNFSLCIDIILLNGAFFLNIQLTLSHFRQI